ncbi:MAG: hypothetical protein AVDCRST_MAG40-1767, partial [uncultured Gemmatimonadaceae bacterium]
HRPRDAPRGERLRCLHGLRAARGGGGRRRPRAHLVRPARGDRALV